MLHYRGRAKRVLESLGIQDYDRIRVRRGRLTYEGILIPRPEILDDDHIILKLDNGYNVGISLNGAEIELVKRSSIIKEERAELGRFDPRKPKVPLIVTGGTITSRVEYSTGAVKSYERPEELLDKVPELADIAYVEYVPLFAEFSENLTKDHWTRIAEEVYKMLKGGAEGVIIAHGTDTMHYTAAALSFMLRNLDKPVILVGSQRSIDRPSSDAVLNLIASAKMAAEGEIADVMIVMHGSPSDEFAYAIRGTRARKMHTSRRDAFQPVNEPPLALVSRNSIKVINPRYRRRVKGESHVFLDAKMDDKVALLYVWPGMPAELLSDVADRFNGFVLAGTGLGHTPKWIIPKIKEIVGMGKPVVIASQCLFGRVDLKVYETGRRLLEAGAIPADDMLPEVALVKLMYVLGHTKDMDEVSKMMRANLSFEIGSRISLRDFPPCWGVCNGL